MGPFELCGEHHSYLGLLLTDLSYDFEGFHFQIVPGVRKGLVAGLNHSISNLTLGPHHKARFRGPRGRKRCLMKFQACSESHSTVHWGSARIVHPLRKNSWHAGDGASYFGVASVP